MKGTNLGELEELILLAIAVLNEDAYGVAIKEEIKLRCNRSMTISTVHAALMRLEKKGYVNSRYAGKTSARGGRRKHIFNLTKTGETAIAETREQRESFWQNISFTSTGKA